MAGKQVTELDALPRFTDTSLLPVHNGAGLKKGLLSQLASYLGTKFSNPNLLINPDFKINQRGQTTYAKDNQGPAIYTVDRWALRNCTLDANSMLLKAHNSGTGLLMQIIENKINGIATVSFEVSSVSGTIIASAGSTSGYSLDEISVTKKGIYQFTVNGEISDITFKISAGGSVTIAWAKLEQGPVATPFVAPNPAEELVKCKRYAHLVHLDSLMCVISGTDCYVRNCADISMRTEPTITILSKKNDDFIVRVVNGSVTNKNLGKPTSIKSLSNGKLIKFIIPNSDNRITMTTDSGISVLLLDAEIY